MKRLPIIIAAALVVWISFTAGIGYGSRKMAEMCISEINRSVGRVDSIVAARHGERSR